MVDIASTPSYGVNGQLTACCLWFFYRPAYYATSRQIRLQRLGPADTFICCQWALAELVYGLTVWITRAGTSRTEASAAA